MIPFKERLLKKKIKKREQTKLALLKKKGIIQGDGKASAESKFEVTPLENEPPEDKKTSASKRKASAESKFEVTPLENEPPEDKKPIENSTTVEKPKDKKTSKQKLEQKKKETKKKEKRLTRKDIENFWSGSVPSVAPKERDNLEEDVEQAELGVVETFVDYMPSKLKIGQKHPDPVLETATLSSVSPAEIWFQLDLPEDLISSGALSALQLEAIVYASQQHEHTLGDGARAGFLLGDGAGVGKGRTIAGLQGPSCDEVEARVAEADRATAILYPPNIIGRWTSDRCESRPGPEYLLRGHYYSDNETFTALLHKYRDPSCSVPWYSSLSTGRLQLSGRSWQSPLTATASFALHSVLILPHSQKAADEVWTTLNSSCPGTVKRQWRAHLQYLIYTSRAAADQADLEGQEWLIAHESCLGHLRLAHDNVTLVKIQVRPPGPPDLRMRRTELLLGEARPGGGTRYQLPLLFLSQNSGSCEVCRDVDRSSVRTPPHLAPSRTSHQQMSGEWVSLRCEPQKAGLYLKRRLKVSGSSWQTDFKFFSDPSCSMATLTASAEGTMRQSGSRRLVGAMDFDFRVLRAFLTVHDEALLAGLGSGGSCGPPGRWQVGVRRDVTPSQGCPPMGIVVPSTEYELVRLETDQSGQSLMYLGLSEQRRDERKARPTAFQPALIQCNVPELPPLTHFLNSISRCSRSPPPPLLVFSALALVLRLLLQFSQ